MRHYQLNWIYNKQQQQPDEFPPGGSTPRIKGGIIPEDAMNATDEKIACDACQKSFAPPTYNRICKQTDKNGELKCIGMYMKKRKVFNSAKIRIQGNEHLDKEAQKQVIQGRMKVVAEKKQAKLNPDAVKKPKENKWKKESESLREAMAANRAMERAKKEGKPLTYYLK